MMFVVTAVLKLSWQSNVRNQLLMELQYDIYIYMVSLKIGHPPVNPWIVISFPIKITVGFWGDAYFQTQPVGKS